MDLDSGGSVGYWILLGFSVGCWIWCKSNVRAGSVQCFVAGRGDYIAERESV